AAVVGSVSLGLTQSTALAGEPAYLPASGPPPLRFALPPAPVTVTVTLPPLEYARPASAETTPSPSDPAHAAPAATNPNPSPGTAPNVGGLPPGASVTPPPTGGQPEDPGVATF